MTSEKRQFARRQRRMPTAVEDTLWQALRNRKLLGLKFRRQVPLLGYTVDLMCFDLKLVIEIDGADHALRREYDLERTRGIESQGYRVVRFPNGQVLEDLQGVLDAVEAIARELHHFPSPLPLSQTGEGFPVLSPLPDGRGAGLRAQAGRKAT
jgi:very-short-patch-repair endonuclease